MDNFLMMLQRLDIESVTLVALRDAVGMALRKPGAANYRETIRLAEVLVPALFHRDRSLLTMRGRESPEARECRAIADTLDIPFDVVVSTEIEKYRDLVERASYEKKDARVLESKLRKLEKINQENRTKEYYEGQLIQRDAVLGVDLPISGLGDGYYDFALPANRGMRIRVTHETRVETINGADLIYENHWIGRGVARIAVIQYKIMEKERYVPKSESLIKQIERLGKHFCRGLPCIPSDLKSSSRFYRLPTCTAFLRATNRLQRASARMISTGRFIPVCKVKNLLEQRKPISLKHIEDESVTYRVFEELFNTNLLGSIWLRYEELEKLYQDQSILEPSESVAMHVQVFEDA